MDGKKKLQEAFPGMTITTVQGCFDILHWTYTEDDSRYTDITCDCGTVVTCAGWFGTESLYCKQCGKGMQDMTGVLPGGGSSASVIKASEYDLSDGHWAPENIWGYKAERGGV